MAKMFRLLVVASLFLICSFSADRKIKSCEIAGSDIFVCFDVPFENGEFGGNYSLKLYFTTVDGKSFSFNDAIYPPSKLHGKEKCKQLHTNHWGGRCRDAAKTVSDR